MNRRRRILMALSGGVDSSVAAALVVEAGYEVVGATMKTFCYTPGPNDPPAQPKTCCGLDGITDARRVADTLGIDHYVFDVEEEFTRDVIDDFVAEYAEGRTPNPCVNCNSNTKFRDLLERGRLLGCDAVASGHYVRIVHGEEESELHRGRDPKKDQSYFLWGLPREMLPRLLFPLGELTKPEVRARAAELGLVTAQKPESQEICFVPTGDYRDFLKKKIRPRHPALQPGPVETLEGEVIGEHDGYAGFTIGQRKGLPGGFTDPWYVVAIDAARKAVIVGSQDNLAVPGVEIGELNWLAPEPRTGSSVRVQLRYRAPDVAATVVEGGDRLLLELDEPQQAVTPGQSAVVFDGERVLGGGRIARALRSKRKGIATLSGRRSG